MRQFNSTEDLFSVLNELIETWCDRRDLKPLSYILGPYLAFSGLTDNWGGLREALRAIRAECADDLSPNEVGIIGEMTRFCDRLIDL